MVNREEAAAVLKQLAGVRFPAEVAVLTTYGAQRALLQQAVKERGLADSVSVLTVDSAQGREWDTVVYTHVASSPERMGFTSSKNRLCVALSRARRELVVVADPRVVGAVPALRAVRAAAFHDSEEVRRVARRAVERNQNAVDVGGNRYKVCVVCFSAIGRGVDSLRCGDGEDAHFLCPDCADGHVVSAAEAPGFDGRVRCPCAPDAAGGCPAAPYEAAAVARVVSGASFDKLNRAVVAIKEREVAKELEEDMERRLADRLRGVALDEQAAVQRAVDHVTERVLTLRCPHCDAPWAEFDGCCALACGACAQYFCAFCQAACHGDQACHDHVLRCQANPLRARGLYVDKASLDRVHRDAKLAKINAYLDGNEHKEQVLARVQPLL